MIWLVLLIVGIGIGSAIYWGAIYISEAIKDLAAAIRGMNR